MSEHHRLFSPPRLFTNIKYPEKPHRGVGWLELFYDLVFVATLIQLGNFLSEHIDPTGFGQFLLMMFVVWWSWLGATFYQNRFVSDDLFHRLLIFLQMFAIALMGLSVSAAFGDLSTQFVIAYVINRVLLVVMYWRAREADEASRSLAQGYAVGFALGAIVWLISLLLPTEIRWIVWLIGVAVEVAVPVMPNMRQLQNVIGEDTHHIAERYGIFTIIVLGEVFIKILDDSQGTVLGSTQLVFSTVGLLVTYGLWWLYFSDSIEAHPDLHRTSSAFSWIYGHFVLATSLVAFGVSAKKFYASTLDYPSDPISDKYRILYMLAIVLYCVAVGMIDSATHTHGGKSRMNYAIVRFVSAGVALVIGLTVTGVNATGFVALMAIVMMAQVIHSIRLSQMEVH